VCRAGGWLCGSAVCKEEGLWEIECTGAAGCMVVRVCCVCVCACACMCVCFESYLVETLR